MPIRRKTPPKVAPPRGRKVPPAAAPKKALAPASAREPLACDYRAGALSGLPNLAADLELPAFPGATATNTVVVASGWGDNGSGMGPIVVRGTVISPTKIRFEVWDKEGTPYSTTTWYSVDIRYAVFRTA